VARNRDEGSYRRTTSFLPLHIYIVARTGRRTEQASSDEGLWYRTKHQGKMFGCVEVIVLENSFRKKQTWLKLFLLHDGGADRFRRRKSRYFLKSLFISGQCARVSTYGYGLATHHL